MECFPRGGKPTTTEQEKTTAGTKRKHSATTDVLFGKKTAEAAKQAKGKKPKNAKTTPKPTTTDKTPKLAAVTAFKSLKKGMLLLGCVSSVSETSAVISLPNKLSGIVEAKQVSDVFYSNKKKDDLPPLTNILQVGQFVPCSVLEVGKTDKGRNLKLSLRCSLFNANLRRSDIVKHSTIYGSIVSIEDHGAIVNMGVKGITGFIPSNDIKVMDPAPAAGQSVFCSVLNINTHTNTATLSPQRETTLKAVTRGDHYSITSFVPGMLMNVKVKQVLDNGLLVSFLNVFKGTIEEHHLSCPCFSTWKKNFSTKTTARARIIAVNPIEKSIALSMAPHIVHFKAPAFTVEVGDIIEEALVHRIDRTIGMLLSLGKIALEPESKPTWADFQPAFAHISRISDDFIERLDKKFKLGSLHKCRVVNMALFDNVVNVTLKTSSIQQAVVRQQDLEAGQLVTGKIKAIEAFGIILELGEGITGLIPSIHLPAVALKKSNKNKVGHKLQARVLSVNEVKNKTYLTGKSALVKSELEPLKDYADAKQGLVAHGMITKIADFGLLVKFFGDVQGIVPMKALVEAGVEDINEAYVEGQIVKACVVRADPSKKRLSLTLDLSKASVGTSGANAEVANKVLGSFVKCTVTKCEDEFLRLKTDDGCEAILSHAHLTDYAGNIDAAVEVYAEEGKVIEKAMVLNKRNDGLLTLTLKPMLINCPENTVFPSTFDQVNKGMSLVGYVRSFQSAGLFVQFLGNLQALAPVSLVSDQYLSTESRELFEEGMTVKCVVHETTPEKSRFVVSLKTSEVGESTTAYIEKFLNERCEYADADEDADEDEKVWRKHSLGSVHKAHVVATRDYGIVMNFVEDPEVTVILESKDSYEDGAEVQVRIVDVDFEKNIFYVSADELLVKGGLSAKGNKKSAKIKPGKPVADVKVVCLREEYAVVSINDTSLAIVQVADWNSPHATCEFIDLSLGQSIRTIGGGAKVLLKSSIYANYSFLALASSQLSSTRSRNSANPQLPLYSADQLKLNDTVQAEITCIKEEAMELRLRAERSAGRVEARVAAVSAPVVAKSCGTFQHPFEQYSVGQIVEAKIVHTREKGANQRKPIADSNPVVYRRVDLSLSPAPEDEKLAAQDWYAEDNQLQKGDEVYGVIIEVEEHGVWIQLNAAMRGFCHQLDLATKLEEIEQFGKYFMVGKPVNATILRIDYERKLIDLSVLAVTEELTPNDVVYGMINRKMKQVHAPSLMLTLPQHQVGRVCIADLADPAAWIDMPLENSTKFAHGEIVQALVLEEQASSRSGSFSVVPVSLRSSEIQAEESGEALSIPSPGDLVQGYVTKTSASGCFVCLSRGLNARVLLRDLADKFLDAPERQFPAGKLVAGRVTKSDSEAKRVEISLKPSVVSEDGSMTRLSDLKQGQHVKGSISSIQKYGVFVKLENSALSALCHVSEMSDDKNFDSQNLFSVGDYVKARILKIDGRRIAVGLKASYFDDDSSSSSEEDDDDDAEEDENEDSEEEDVELPNDDDAVPADSDAESMDEDEASDDDGDDDEAVDMEIDDEVPAKAASSGMKWSGFDLSGNADDESDESSDDDEEEETQASKKKAKISEESIREREKYLMNGQAVPETAEDFERLIVASPNNSYLWIKYMQFQLSMTETDLARDIAERALKTINFRDQQEKLNIWISYLNLEQQYGDDDSLRNVFNRAVQVNNPKRVYMQLVDIYRQNDRFEDAETTLKTMRKKFKKSKKVWSMSCEFYFDQKKVDEANSIFRKSLKSLAKHKHLFIISKFGQFEYQYGSLDRARSIYDGILTNYPKRLDLYNVYIDKEIKYGQDKAVVRQLFERTLKKGFSAYKLKGVFKKYMQYEMKHGDAKSVQHVKDLVAKFVEEA